LMCSAAECKKNCLIRKSSPSKKGLRRAPNDD
jgi:hypothetical protein